MAKFQILKGSTSILVRVLIQDASKTNGAGLTGLTNLSTGLTCYVARDDDGNAAATQLALTAGTRGTWSSGGFKEKDATNQPGVYEFGLSNASLATGSRSCTYYLQGAANMAPCIFEIELTNTDNQSATFGLGTLTANTTQLAGQTVTAAAGVTFPTSIASPTNITAGTITTTTNLTNAPTNGDFTTAMKTSLNAATPASITGNVGGVSGVTFPTLVASTTNITAATGIDITKILGTAISTPATAGIMDVNIKKVNNVTVNGVGTAGSPWSP